MRRASFAGLNGGGGKARAGKNSFPPTQYERNLYWGFCFLGRV